MKLVLKYPLNVGQAIVGELNFRDFATAADLLAFDAQGAVQQTIKLITNLSGSDEEIIKRLHITDYRAADKIVSDLIAPEASEKNAAES